MAKLKRDLEARYGFKFNIGVDLLVYRDGRDSCGWHADDTQGVMQPFQTWNQGAFEAVCKTIVCHNTMSIGIFDGVAVIDLHALLPARRWIGQDSCGWHAEDTQGAIVASYLFGMASLIHPGTAECAIAVKITKLRSAVFPSHTRRRECCVIE